MATGEIIKSLKSDLLSHHEAEILLEEIRKVVDKTGLPYYDNKNEITEAITSPQLGVNHKLKIAIPIIPLLLSYEGEIGVEQKIDLETLWNKILLKLKKQILMF